MTPSLQSAFPLGNLSIGHLPHSVTTAVVSMPEIMLLNHKMQQKDMY